MIFFFIGLATYAFYLIMMTFKIDHTKWVHYFMFGIMITVLSIVMPIPIFNTDLMNNK